MNAWLLSIVGVVALGVLLEILLAEGETSKYIKGVFALSVVLVLVAPLPKFFDKNFDIGAFFGEEISTQTSFLEKLNEREGAARETKLKKALVDNKIPASRVRIFYLRGTLDVVKIYLNGTADKDKICDITTKMLGCDKDAIKIYVEQWRE